MKEINIKYNFYKKYNKYNKKLHIIDKINKRIKKISEENFLEINDKFLEEYFTDIFSWSVIPYKLLKKIEKLLLKYNIKSILDLSCGNAFHMFLFNNFTKLYTYPVDIQNENESWLPITVIDARSYLKQLNNIKSNNMNNIALFLSWIDYDELALDLIKNYKGNIVISIGNYELRSKKYLNYLYKNFKIIKKYVLKMPWNRTENIEILHRIICKD